VGKNLCRSSRYRRKGMVAKFGAKVVEEKGYERRTRKKKKTLEKTTQRVVRQSAPHRKRGEGEV